MSKYKWLVTLIGVIALSILVWFAGPYIAVAEKKILEGEVVRLLVIMALVLLWGLNNLRLSMQARSGNEKLAKDLQGETEKAVAADGLGNESGAESHVLNDRFKEAIETLRRSSGTSNRYSKNYLYELPWYILIGPPGSGKTTALVNSGLNFPLEEKFGRGAVQGVGGTRHCDWWFTDQAVMIDTAGRYTTQDSHATQDSKAWIDFIMLLKRYRKRRPINGVVIAIGVDELTRQTEQELSANVNSVRARLQELTRHLGVKFPVYLLLTKCDLIPGFTQYFDMMGKEERAQVWGTTFSEKPESNLTYQQMFEDEHDLLSKRLHDGVMTKFHFEREVTRRSAILSFPGQFERLKPMVADFVGRTFSESRFHDQYLLRGVYYTSGTQEAAGMQRMMQNVAGQMGFSQQALLGQTAQGKSYFLRNLFQQVVFPEAELVSANRGYESKLRWARNLGYGASLTSAVGMAAVWSTSYGLNESSLNRTQEQLDLYVGQQAKLHGDEYPAQMMEPMQPLLALRKVYQPSQDGWKMGVGLYQGDAIDIAAENEYELVLQDQFYRSIQKNISQQLVDNQGVPEYLHMALKAYLMLSLPQRLEKEYVSTWVRADWMNRYADQPETLNALNARMDDLMQLEWSALQADDQLVENTRFILRKLPLADQIYASIKDKAQQKMPQEYRFDSNIGNDIHHVFNGEFVAIPWLFTAEGYHDFFKPQQDNLIEELAEDSWVVGARNQDMDDMDLADIKATIEKRYLDDYIGYWRSAISQLRLQSSNSLEEHVRLLNEMLSGSSPLRRVLDETVAHTQLSKPLIDPAMLTENATEAKQLAQKIHPKAGKIARIASLAGKNRLVKLPEIPATLVDKRFEPLHDLMGADNKSSAPFERVYASLTELQVYLEGISSGGSSNQAAFDAAIKRMSNGRTDPIGKLKLEARHLPEPVKQWVESLANRAWSHTLGAARAHVTSEYNIMVKPFYERSIDGRYPIAKSSEVDITLADFAEFFKPDGIEHQFFKQYLAPFVDTRSSPWRARIVDGQGLAVSKTNLMRFEQANHIRKAFFANGDAPQIRFNLRAIYLDANINRFELSLLGERLQYRHGPARVDTLTWPLQGGSGGIKYLFEDHYGVQFSDQVQGTWALFRFLDQFPLLKTGYSDRFKLTVQDKERKAVYELHASSAQNPFIQDYLGNYRLPNAL
ncbi:MAG: type VI secretion system membrane subunit TssM [Ketobacter sp.]